MIELHGWALLRESHAPDDDNESVENLVSHITQEIKDRGIDDELLQIAFCNGEATLTVTKLANHFS